MNNDLSFLMHDIVNISHDVSIATIGKLSNAELQELKNVGIDYLKPEWPSQIEERDLLLQKEFYFNEKEVCKKNDFVLLGVLRDSLWLKKAIKDRFSDLPDFANFDSGAFSAYFAHIHNDAFNQSRGQINLVLENKLGHSLISVSENGTYHKVTPEAGDIVFLDIYCQHALIPNDEHDFRKIRKHPMNVIYTAISCL